VAGLAAATGPVPAFAGVEAWRVNEVVSEPGQPTLRYVELYAPPSGAPDNCFFSTTRLEVLDAAGVVVGTVTPFPATTCYGGDTYFLFATSEAAAAFGVDADASLSVVPAPVAGQVCLRSGAIRYDCARWGAVSVAVVDQENPADMSSAPSIPAGLALTRIADTSVVSADFDIGARTPRGPNDGTPWFPPDAGPPPPDAAPAPDAPPPADAAPPPAFDATPIDFTDARESPPVFLDAEPGGGGCSVGHRAGGGTAMLVLLALVCLMLRSVRHGR
jgi:hypothetical protein